MEINKKIDTAVKHLFNYFNDNEYDRVESLYVISVFQTIMLNKILTCPKRNKNNEDVFKEFKEYF